MDPVFAISVGAALLALLTAGVFIYRCRVNLPSILLASGLSVLSFETVCSGLSATVLLPEHMLSLQRLRLLMAAAVPGIWLSFSLVYARTNYREFMRLWRVPLAAAALLPVLLVVAGWDRLLTVVNIEEGRLYWTQQVGVAGLALRVAEILAAVLILMNLEKTLRQAHGTMRWRVKFLLAGILVVFAARIYLWGQTLLSHVIDPVHDTVGALALMAGCVLVLLSLRRSPRMQMDLYVSTDMVFGSFTVVAVAIYLMVVGGLAYLWTHGTSEVINLLVFLGVLVAAVLLLLLLLSDRARVAARMFFVRHLRRPTFDYRQLWRDFSERTLHATNAEELAREAARLTSETFEALSVSLWLLDEDKNLCLVASTALGGAHEPDSLPAKVADDLVNHWKRTEFPVDMDRAWGIWAELMRDSNPGQFREGGHRFCMPLRAAGEALGVMIIGDRVSGIPFSVEELDLFRILADQTAARLLTIRIAERLMEAKQMEAFQLMSTFLVHDLKNTASSLSLTLQNLRTYFDDPEFRKDAEKSISAGVQKMNEVIRRLASLRRVLELEPSTVDFNALVSGVLQQLEGVTAGGVQWRPGPSLQVRLDPEQMKTVITNLVLNAREASPTGRMVEVASAGVDGYAVLSVRDEGCGMSADFIAQRLFHPFQTTKKEGMGIGLFQSRMIVEAHGGRIEVQSEPDRGSTFRVRLPLEVSK